LVSEALFATVQERLAENRQRNRQSRRGAKYLLQGLLVCRCCGYALYGKPVSISAAKGKKRHYAYYRCIGTDAYRYGGERICNNKQVRTDLLEEAVWEDVSELLRNPKRIQHEYQRRLAHDDTSAHDTQQFQDRIQGVKRGIARLVDAYEDGLLEKTDFEPRIRRLRDRLAKLEGEAQAAVEQQQQRATLRLVIGQLEEFARHVEKGLHDADWAKRREIIRALVKRIEVDEGKVQVVYRIDPPPFDAAPSRGRLQDCWRRGGTALGDAAVGVRGLRGAALAFLGAFHHRHPQPLLDRRQHVAVSDSPAQAPHQRDVRDCVQEALDVGIQYPIHRPVANRHRQGVQRLMTVAMRTEAITETEKVLLVNALEDPQHRLLDDLVFQRRNPQRALPPIGLGDPASTRRLGSVGSPVNTIMEVRDVDLQVLLIFLPGYSIDADGRRLLQVEERFGQAVFVHVVQQGGESEPTVLAGSFTHAVQSA
jgi:hypothetical protein